MERSIVPSGGDTNAGRELEVLNGLFVSIATILVILRFYVRAYMVKRLWWDDLLLLLGIVSSFVEYSAVER